MLNISQNSVSDKIDITSYSAWKNLEKRAVAKGLIRTIIILLIILIISMFLPWTQNIRSKGYVTTLRPEQRPQAIQSIIGGRIEQWYVREGDVVIEGDTLLKISESKQEYFDPKLLENTGNQIEAKSQAIDAYEEKARNLKSQYNALLESQKVKIDQNDIKMKQVRLKIESDSLDLVAAKTKFEIAENQLDRIQSLYDDGIKSLTDLEAKRLSVREAQAKVLSLENKIFTSKNDLVNLETNIVAITNEYNDKLSKSQSERMSALSNKYNADATKNKLESSYNAYEQRAENYYVTAPVSGLITKAVIGGIGELVKQGEDIVTIIPSTYDLAVEMYVEPRDMPLLKKGQRVRVQFDGWPAIVFSGWPNSSVGTFAGQVFAIDNYISKNGKYRILVSELEGEMPWPKEVRVGGGANAITLLNEVKVGYELWRQLNGFPQDYYDLEKQADVETKAPLRKIK